MAEVPVVWAILLFIFLFLLLPHPPSVLPSRLLLPSSSFFAFSWPNKGESLGAELAGAFCGGGWASLAWLAHPRPGVGGRGSAYRAGTQGARLRAPGPQGPLGPGPMWPRGAHG